MENRAARKIAFGIIAGVALTFLVTRAGDADTPPGNRCPPVGIWMSPATGKHIATFDLIREMSKRPVVLLGETHTNAEHHRWQLQVISALYGINPNMVIGFEAFPRDVQPVLDQWIRGDLNEKEFLEKSRWFDVWQFDPGLYMPLFHFARMNRIPVRALNVERALTRRIGKEGWATIPVGQRAGLGDPAPPSPAYLASLKKVYGSHSDDETPIDETAFGRFVDVQLTWDRAMAEALASARTSGGEPLVIGIVGRGHLEYRYGIPHQLDDLGVRGSGVLLPSDSGPPCNSDDPADAPADTVADILFGVATPVEPDAPPRPLLGVQIENIDTAGTKSVRIVKVTEHSIAETTGLQTGDLIVRAAERDVTGISELVATIRRQAPGTWLPLTIQRGDERLEFVARFPALP